VSGFGKVFPSRVKPKPTRPAPEPIPEPVPAPAHVPVPEPAPVPVPQPAPTPTPKPVPPPVVTPPPPEPAPIPSPVIHRPPEVRDGRGLADAVRALQAGQTLTVWPGEYRDNAEVKAAGVTLVAPEGAVITGSDVVTMWAHAGSTWWTPWTPLPSNPTIVSGWPTMLPGRDWAARTEHVFLDGRALELAPDPAAVKPGTFAVLADRIVIGDDPAGRVVEVSKRRYWLRILAEGVTARGLTMRHAANLIQQGGALDLAGGRGALVLDCDLGHASGAVLDLSGRGHTVSGCRIHHGGQLGVTGKAYDLLFEANEVSHNNVRGFDPAWAAGGTKFHQGGVDSSNPPAQQLRILRNRVHSNNGPGLWADVWVNDALLEGNRVWGNAYQGINIELSMNVDVLRNVAWRNGFGLPWPIPSSRVDPPAWGLGAAYYVLASRNVRVQENIAVDNADGVTVWQDDRWGARTTGVSVDRNTIVQGAAPGDPRAISWLQSGGGVIDQASCGGSGNRVLAASGVRFEAPGLGLTSDRAAFARSHWDWEGGTLTAAEVAAILQQHGIPANL
jgi:hypothetical protein